MKELEIFVNKIESSAKHIISKYVNNIKNTGIISSDVNELCINMIKDINKAVGFTCDNLNFPIISIFDPIKAVDFIENIGNTYLTSLVNAINSAKNIEIIVMGQTGTGKSTLINSILGEELAPTGVGSAVTKENKIYPKLMSKSNRVEYCKINNKYSAKFVSDRIIYCKLYDTVGLEINSKITDDTLLEIKKHIDITKKLSSSDKHIVFFCIRNGSERFQTYELDLLKKLSMEYELPFVIVLTQCYNDEKGELEIQIEKELPEVLQRRVLAKEYKYRNGIIIPAYGVNELLTDSINNYHKLKVKILQTKHFEVKNKIDNAVKENNNDLDKIKKICRYIITNNSSKVHKWRIDYTKVPYKSFVVKSIVRKVNRLIKKMVKEINKFINKMIKDIDNYVGVRDCKKLERELLKNEVKDSFLDKNESVSNLPISNENEIISYIEKEGDSYLDYLIELIKQNSNYKLLDDIQMRKLFYEGEKIKEKIIREEEKDDLDF